MALALLKGIRIGKGGKNRKISIDPVDGVKLGGKVARVGLDVAALTDGATLDEIERLVHDVGQVFAVVKSIRDAGRGSPVGEDDEVKLKAPESDAG